MRTLSQNPVFTNEKGCEEIGFLKVDHPVGETLSDKEMQVVFVFGDTELHVKVTVMKTGKTTDLSIDYLK